MDEDKVAALAEFLQVDPSTISNEYGEYYAVNERTEKEGKTPEQIQKTIDDFRSLLTPNLKRRITWKIKKGFKKKGATNQLYEDIKDHLETQKDSEVYKQLSRDNLYIENVAYNLLMGNGYNIEYYLDLGRAWLRQPLEDHRDNRTRNDGEYLVFTDSEADDWEREGLENLFEEMTYEVPEHLKRFMDEDAYVEEYSGQRGQNISGYNGIEDEVEFEGTTYYIYRTN